MKYIVAIIQPDCLNAAMDELGKQGVDLVTVTEVMGHGRQKGEAQVYRGHKEAGRLLRKIKLEIAVNDDYVDKTISAITTATRTEQIGDGKIFVLPLEQCARIRTGEVGPVAIG
ncbi:MAG: transcriptional regulator [Phycisphaeraceae bacterium]|nr:transcriptional regulator [Phycisphaeraceae bacterium]